MNSRFHAWDTLKSFFLFLAMWEHYAYFNNFWFVYYSANASALNSPMPVSYSALNYFLLHNFIPWVGHSFLFLACMHIGRKFRSGHIPNLKLWPIYFLVATLENVFVSVDIGDAVSLQPLQTWVLLFATILIILRLTGRAGIIILLVCYLALLERHLVPLGDQFQVWMNQFPLLSSFEYNSRLEYFFGTACVGFLLGDFFHKVSPRKAVLATALGVAALIPWYFWGTAYRVTWNNVLFMEYSLARKVIDLFFIWGMNTAAVSGFLALELKGLYPRLKVLEWIGTQTLWIYLFHQIFFLKIWGPVRENVGDWVGYPFANDFSEMVIASLLAIGFAMIMKFLFLRARTLISSV